MKYSIFINPNSENSLAAAHAVQFIKAILGSKHEVFSVFFYGYAVNHAFIETLGWSNIAQQNVKLIACSTIAESYVKDGMTVVDYFEVSGLGQWIHAVLQSDKHIEFI